jgi:dTDP-glucose pyrophosphorylase/CBS domain-containing protein
MIDSKRLDAILVSPTTTIGNAIAAIDRGALSIALVVTAERGLLGTITDGDVRRAILRGVALEQPAQDIMNPHPTWVTATTSLRATQELMRRRAITRIPVVDDELRLVGLRRLEDLLDAPLDGVENLVVLMAGGLGQRLRPLTTAVPKPMLPVGGRPLLETLVQGFRDQGFRRVCLAVNYLSEVVEGHFGDGSAFGVDIRYVRETEPLGTIGALSLLDEPADRPVIVMNGDVLTKVNFNSLLEFHQANGYAMTLCVRHYEFQVPYGVVELQDARVASVEEKPVKGFFVNAGIYVLDPDVVGTIPRGAPTDATDVVQRLIAEGRPVGSFPVREYWIDVGSHADLERAGKEFVDTF